MNDLRNIKVKNRSSVRWMLAACALIAGVVVGVRADESVLWWQVDTDPDVFVFHPEGYQKASSLGADEARIVTSEGDYLVIPPSEESLEIPMGGAWYAVLPDSPEGLSFMVELGNWESGNWTMIAQSQSYTYAELVNHIIENWSGPGATPAIQPWVATGYMVPEPSSGLLLLMGAGLLALRRKRRD